MSEQQFFNLSIPFEKRKEEILNYSSSLDTLYKKFAKKQKLKNEEDFPIYYRQIYSINQNIFKCKNCEGTLFNPCHHFQNQNNINLLKQFLSNIKDIFDQIQLNEVQLSNNEKLGKKRNGDNIFNNSNKKKNNGITSQNMEKETIIKKYFSGKTVLFEISPNNINNQTFNFIVLRKTQLISIKLIICSKFSNKFETYDLVLSLKINEKKVKF